MCVSSVQTGVCSHKSVQTGTLPLIPDGDDDEADDDDDDDDDDVHDGDGDSNGDDDDGDDDDDDGACSAECDATPATVV